jgi:hypothetical protein
MSLVVESGEEGLAAPASTTATIQGVGGLSRSEGCSGLIVVCVGNLLVLFFLLAAVAGIVLSFARARCTTNFARRCGRGDFLVIFVVLREYNRFRFGCRGYFVAVLMCGDESQNVIELLLDPLIDEVWGARCGVGGPGGLLLQEGHETQIPRADPEPTTAQQRVQSSVHVGTELQL